MHEAMTKIEARALLVGHNASANALWLLSGLIVFLPWVLTPLARRVIALPQAQEAFRSMGGETAALMMVFVISLLALAACVLLCAPLKAGRMAWFWRQSGRNGRHNGIGALFSPFRPAGCSAMARTAGSETRLGASFLRAWGYFARHRMV